MSKYRKIPIVIEATQWFKNGDHPLDNSQPSSQENSALSEGEIVRRYKNPETDGKRCFWCGHPVNEHGWIDTWIDTLEGGYIVCVGDYIITGARGEHYPCKPDVFEATYEKVI